MTRPEGASVAGTIAALVTVALSSCCALPMALVFAGVSGGLVGSLGPVFAMRPYILTVAGVLLVLGWWLALRRRARRVYAVLAVGTALLAFSLYWPVWDPALQRLLMESR